MPVIVHVNTHTIRRNAKTAGHEPPLIIRRGKAREYAHEVELIGPARVVHSPHKPLDCGARVWIECQDARPVVADQAGTPRDASPPLRSHS